MSTLATIRRVLFRTLAPAAGLVAVSSNAQVVLSNLGSTTLASAQVSLTQYIAQPFTTSAENYSLESVSVRMNSAQNTSGNFFVSITSGDIKPLDDLGSGGFSQQLVGTENPSANGTFLFTATGGLSLQANTTYWIVMGVDEGAGIYRWYFPNSTTFQTSVWTVGNVIGNSADQGATWSLISGFNPYMFSISASVSAVPEPSTYAAMAGVAALGLAFWRKRRSTLTAQL